MTKDRYVGIAKSIQKDLRFSEQTYIPTMPDSQLSVGKGYMR